MAHQSSQQRRIRLETVSIHAVHRGAVADKSSDVLYHRSSAVQLPRSVRNDSLIRGYCDGMYPHLFGRTGDFGRPVVDTASQQTYYLCPGGPQALASCVCIKDGMSAEVLKKITSSVKWSCSSTASEDISSAAAVSPPDEPMM